MRILFAIGNRNAEEYLQGVLEEKNKERILNEEEPKNYEFVGYAVHKDNIIDLIRSKGPDIIILREGFEGFKNIPPGSETNEVPEIFSFAKSLKRAFPNLRIIFLAGQRGIGDRNLGILVSYNIYDILVGSNLKITEVAEVIDNPKKFEDVSMYLPTDYDIIEDFEVKEDKKEDNSLTIDKKEFLVVEETPVTIEKKETPSVAPGGDVVVVAGGDNNTNTNTNNKNSSGVGSLFNTLMSGAKNAKDSISKTNVENSNSQKPKGQVDRPEPTKNVFDNNIKPRVDSNPRQRPRGRQTNIYTGKDKIVTFYGSKNGIGTTLISFSVAMELALRKNKVLYIEYNDTNPTIAYWLGVYDATNYEDGIDKAILGYETNSLKDANDAITTNQNLIKGSEDFSAIFKKYPPTLDMLFFSEDYLLRRDKEPISSTSFTQLLLYYMQQLNYNYIIVDIKTGTNIGIIERALTFSNKNYIILSQDVSSIGYCKQYFEALNKKGLDFVSKNNGNRSVNDKNNYIINRYSNRISLNERAIRDWFETNSTFTVPENSEEINELSFKCLPIMLASKNRMFRESISYIASDVETL